MKTCNRIPDFKKTEPFDALVLKAAVTHDDEVLDVSCGTGRVACAFARKAAHVVGIDSEPAMIEKARALQAEQGLNNLFLHAGDVRKLPFPDGAFSVAVTRHPFLKSGTAVEELLRVTRPGGRVIAVMEDGLRLMTFPVEVLAARRNQA